MYLTILLILAVFLVALRLPAVMTRLDMSQKDKLLFVLMAFGMLGVTWMVAFVIDKYF